MDLIKQKPEKLKYVKCGKAEMMQQSAVHGNFYIKILSLCMNNAQKSWLFANYFNKSNSVPKKLQHK